MFIHVFFYGFMFSIYHPRPFGLAFMSFLFCSLKNKWIENETKNQFICHRQTKTSNKNKCIPNHFTLQSRATRTCSHAIEFYDLNNTTSTTKLFFLFLCKIEWKLTKFQGKNALKLLFSLLSIVIWWIIGTLLATAHLEMVHQTLILG